MFENESHNDDMEFVGMQPHRRLELAETFACAGTY
jgi:hypothetical protein